MHRTQSEKPKKKIEAKEIKISLFFSPKEKKENRDARAAAQPHDCGLICGYERREHQKPNNINARWRRVSASKGGRSAANRTRLGPQGAMRCECEQRVVNEKLLPRLAQESQRQRQQKAKASPKRDKSRCLDANSAMR